MKNFSKNSLAFLLVAAAFVLTACNQQPTTTVNGNQTNISNVPGVGNVNVTTNTNSNNLLTGEGTGIEAAEPDQYQATVTLSGEVGGEKSALLPKFSAQVAKMGDNKRMEISLPSNEKLIYLERGGQQFVISPNRKQYAELTKEALGVDPRPLLMPGQIVKQIKNIRGVERVGEEKFGDRDVIKYRYNATAKSNTQAGNVATDAVVLVDKQTSLPLRSETFAESQNSSVGGVSRVRLVTEMTNLQMTVDPALFNEPSDYKKVAPQEIRAQLDAVAQMAGAFLSQMMRGQSTGGNANTAPPPPSPANTNASPGTR